MSEATHKVQELELLPNENPNATEPPPAEFVRQEIPLNPARRRSRGKQGRDPICSKYRMAWVMVFFDLPVGTLDQRRDAANFRKDLIADGYFMLQFSVYARPCGSADRVDTHVRRLKSRIPPQGEVRALLISDAQWGRMIIVRGQQRKTAEKMPDQLMFF